MYGQGTAFSYGGRLSDGGAAAGGLYELRFKIYDAVSAGNLVAAPLTHSATDVSNGLFNVTLDFGAGVFTGAERWLEISVRTNGSSAAFAVLTPRQALLPTPYAIRALTAGGVPAGAITSSMLTDGSVTAAKLAPGAVAYLGAPDGSPTNAVMVNALGLVGIGTTNVQAVLDIGATAAILSSRRLFQVQDETSGYTNLNAPASIAVFGNLLAVSGRGDNGVTVLDISIPQDPILRSQFRDGDGSFTNLNGARGVAMKANLLAVVADVDNAVTLVSLANPASPVRLAELRDGVGGWNELSGAQAVAISGNLMAIRRIQRQRGDAGGHFQSFRADQARGDEGRNFRF